MRGRIALLPFLFAWGVLAASPHAQPSSPDSTAAPQEFHADQTCRLSETGPQGAQPHIYRDRGICNVDLGLSSSRVETDIVNGRRKHSRVFIREHTFTFHNPTMNPAMFVLDQKVPRGWQIDSDPAPNQVHGPVATFFVAVAPGQTVSLHVGERTPPAQ